VSDTKTQVVVEQTDHGYTAGLESETKASHWYGDSPVNALSRAAHDRVQGAVRLAQAAAEEAEAARLLTVAALQTAGLGADDLPEVTVADQWGKTRIEQAERERNRLAGILADLDRCEHGRHEGDDCTFTGGCGGPSKGNPLMREDRTIGFGLDGHPITVPLRGESWAARTR
jgi:hypothetical protein